MLLLIDLYGQPLGTVLTGPDLAEELVRTMASGIALVLAVPLTTALAVAVLVAAGAGIVTAVPAAAEDMPATVSWHGIKASPYVALW